MSDIRYIAAAIGVAGVVLGVVLRPIFESWYLRRKRSLLLEWTSTLTGLGVVGEGGLQLLFDEKPIRLAYWRDFTIRNRTGSTLRDLNLIVTYDPPTNDEQVDPHFQFQTYKSNDIVVSASRHIEERMFSYEIERFDRGGKWSGRVMATYRADIRLVTNNDVEVFQSDRMSVFHPKQLMWQAGPLILFLIAINLNKIFD